MSKKDILARLKRAGFVLFDARPFTPVIMPYDISSKKHVKAIRRLLPDALQIDMATCDGLCSSASMDGYHLILIGVRMTHPERHAALAHEAYHAVNFVYRICGAYHDLENDEHTAYFLQDIYRQSLQILEEYSNV